MERFRFHRRHLSKFLRSRKAKLTFQSLYIHIPFCKRKCHYCDFYSCVPSDSETVSKYLRELRTEYDFFRGLLEGNDFKTLYVGGGTPGILHQDELSYLFERVIGIDLRSLSEATVEANPESLSREKLEVLKAYGITRISLGVQSLNDRVLDFLGRLHDVKTSVRAASLIKEFGFNLNVDLMYGIPGEDFESLKRTVKSALDLNPESVSAYAFTTNKGRFRGKPLKSDESYFEEYAYICDSLRERGYVHYEVSNWAKQGRECLHNLNYWLRQNYLGLGPSAASLFENLRFKCSPSLEDYLSSKSSYFVEELSEEQVRIETAYLLLRTNRGVSKELLSETDESTLEQLESRGLIILKEKNIYPTEKGMFLADALTRELIL